MTLDALGRLTVAGHAQRDVYRFESLNPEGRIAILADRYQSLRLNSPNDLVYCSDGSLYFTDPPYGLRKQNDSDPDKDLKVNGVYRIPQALTQKAGSPPARDQLQLLISDLPRPNGIAFSPGEKYLYVDSTEPKKIWMRYRVLPGGTLAEPKLLYDATSDPRAGAPDGMKVDVEGNIYSAGPGGVWIISPEGKALATIDHARARFQRGLGWPRSQDALHHRLQQRLSRPPLDSPANRSSKPRASDRALSDVSVAIK